MAKVEFFKNSYIHNLNSEYMNNLNDSFKTTNLTNNLNNNFKNIEVIHPYFSNTLNIENTNLNYFKNILKTQKLNNLKKNKLQDFFLV